MRLVDTVATRFGRIDILFLNPGTATNARGPYFTIQYALPLLTNGASVMLNDRSLVHTSSAELVARGIRVETSMVEDAIAA